MVFSELPVLPTRVLIPSEHTVPRWSPMADLGRNISYSILFAALKNSSFANTGTYSVAEALRSVRVRVSISRCCSMTTGASGNTMTQRRLFFSFQEDLKAWTSNITICIAEYKAMKKWDKPDVSSLDPDHSERKEKSEGDADARSERSEQALGDERSDKGDRSEKLDTSEIADKIEGGVGESSTSLKSK